jgi:hypothetical protein
VSKPGQKADPHAVKDAMIRREADWLKTLGGLVSSREIEERVDRGMERLYARRREAVPPKLKRPARKQQVQAKPGEKVWRKPAAPQRQRGPQCKWCGVCVDCKRATRLRTIQDLGRKGDPACEAMSWDFVALVNAFVKGSPYRDYMGRYVDFGEISAAQRTRVFIGAFESICDRSVATMGTWR